MKAFLLSAPGVGEVVDVPAPLAALGQAVVEVERVGVCGTDAELFAGEMAYLQEGHSHYPLRLGHEWCGIVRSVGADVEPRLVGRRVVGDTMIGCGECRRCRRGAQHVCAGRLEVGVRDGQHGALAEQIAVAASSLHVLPDDLDPMVGALVEPSGNSLRAARAAALTAGDQALVIGPGTIGLITGMFLLTAGVDVHVMGVTDDSLALARSVGFDNTWAAADRPGVPFDAVVDATNSPEVPALALELVEPGGRVVYIGLAGQPSQIDTRSLALKDVTAVGILSASPALDDTVRALARGDIDPRPLVAATVALDQVGAVLSGHRPRGAGRGPKIHVDPLRTLFDGR